MASPPEPSEFAVAVAVGYCHVMDRVLGFLERTTARTSPVVAISLAFPVLVTYLVAVTLAFVTRIAADGFAHIVACGGGDDGEVALGALSPAAVLGSVSIRKLAVYLVLLSALTVALF